MTMPRIQSQKQPINYAAAIAFCVMFVALIGCRSAKNAVNDNSYFQDYLTQIEYPEIDEASFQSAQDSLTERPPSVSEYEELEFQDLTLDEAIQLALSNSKVLSRIGGQIVNAPQAAISTFDPAIQESSLGGVENALSSFDTRWDSSINFVRNERRFNNAFQSLLGANTSNNAQFSGAFTKRTPYGSTFGLRKTIDYNRNNIPGPVPGPGVPFLFRSTYDLVIQAEFRQALMRGAGTLVNQVAGPNSQPGFYNGVLIARIGHDLTLADFEAEIRNMVRQVERNYWELYYAYRNLDALIRAREAAREAWEKRKRREKIDRPDEEAQARQQYFNFERQVQNALAGNVVSPGLYSAERELRRLIGLNAGGSILLRPSTEPIIAKYDFDWNNLQMGAMERRVELRRQQWVVKQRELEYLAAQNLNKWQLDFVANYGWRGFGDTLLGNTSVYDDLLQGNLNDWNMGFEFGGPIGKRQTFVAVRNAELQLAKSRAVLREQQRQVVLNLNQAFVEADRTYANIRSNYNAREAIKDELKPKRQREELGAGDEEIFFFREALQRAANTENLFSRAIVDYNLALVDIAFESGQLLSRYNIQIAEGPWTEDAYENAASRDLKFSE